MRGKVILLDQQNTQSPTRRVARDAATVYPAANNEQIELSGIPHAWLDNATWREQDIHKEVRFRPVRTLARSLSHFGEFLSQVIPKSS